jgi:hypothetical protein
MIPYTQIIISLNTLLCFKLLKFDVSFSSKNSKYIIQLI